jgi:hypothetical protein
MASEVNFRAVAADVGDAAVLVGAMAEEIRELYWDVAARMPVAMYLGEERR